MVGVGAAIEHEALLASLSVATVVDIGANLGQFSLLAWELFPATRIHAFEPQADVAERFERLFRNVPTVLLRRSAIGTRTGAARLHISRSADSSSLLPIAQEMIETFPGTEEIGIVEVPIAPLSSFLSARDIAAPALLKIDVQGSELDVLQACEDLIDRFRYIFVELSFRELYLRQPLCSEVVHYLDSKAFGLKAVGNIATDASGSPVQADFLLESESRWLDKRREHNGT